MRTLRGIVNTNELIIVYITLVQSHIDYGITTYGYAPSITFNVFKGSTIV